MATIWVYTELGQSGPQSISLELLSRARELGDVTAIALGPGSCAAAGKLGRHGAGKVYAGEDPAFAEYLAEPATDTMTALVERSRPWRPRELPAGRGPGPGTGRSGRRQPCHRRRRLGPLCAPGGPDRQDGRPRRLHRGRDLGRHATHGGHEILKGDHRDQQGRR